MSKQQLAASQRRQLHVLGAALAVTGTKRSPLMPNVLTMADTGSGDVGETPPPTSPSSARLKR